MFGYVRFFKPELKIKEYETYRAVYCSLCKYMGKEYGLISRMTLSYDFTFLALLSAALQDTCPAFKGGRCTFNPLKKCNYAKDSAAFDMPAAAAVITVYNKVLDNINDSKSFKKLGFLISKPIFSSMRKRAAKKYPEIDTAITEYMQKQALLEKDLEQSVDKAADPTANALGYLFSLCSEDENNKRVLMRLGYCIGRYIYLLDAACDFEEDKKSGSYNVFKGICNTKEEVIKTVTPQLYNNINEAAKAFELLELKRYKTILGNVLYLGLENCFKKELQNEKSL